ncbi:MAG TPA: DCC1-like thiol-disulfide oxidoreductase family protein [Phycisphaerales bacterium]|nr:DCC1-like thiol-disulfide oxidoreductase family protein [Phycisphaerales bacterium]
MPRDTCYYDGRCGLCRRTSRRLRLLDWLGRLDFVDMTLIDPADLPVPPDAAFDGMPMRTSDGRVLVGFHAVRRALTRTPLGLVPGAMLHLPGVSWVGGRVYARVASRRRRDGSCSAPM